MRLQPVAQMLLHVACAVPEASHAVDRGSREMEAVEPVQQAKRFFYRHLADGPRHRMRGGPVRRTA